MHLSLNIDDALLNQAKQITGLQSDNDLVETAVAFLIDQKSKSINPINPAKVFLASGFIGCGQGDPELSENYKAELTELLREKHGDS